jgi:hypothetical protein
VIDADFLQAFEECTLPYEEWDHRAHLKVAFLYLRELPLQAATETVRAGIKRFNAAKDVPESPLMGYNETTTVAFLHIVAATMAAYGAHSPADTADEFCDHHPQLMSRQILRLFYSPARRTHPDAKTTFIEPDLTSLPRILSEPHPDG